MNKNVSIAIRRIKEYSFFINEQFYVPDKQEFKVELSVKLSFAIETNLVFLLARVYYHYADSLPDETITDITVQNVFEIDDLKSFQVSDTEIKLPGTVITSLVDLSLSHTRALLAKNILGTTFQENVMAIIDAGNVARHFFPKMFEPAS